MANATPFWFPPKKSEITELVELRQLCLLELLVMEQFQWQEPLQLVLELFQWLP